MPKGKPNRKYSGEFKQQVSELPYLQEFKSIDYFKQELIEYINHCNNRRIKARLKGLAA